MLKQLDIKTFAAFRSLPKRVQHVAVEPMCVVVLLADGVTAFIEEVSKAHLNDIRASVHEYINE